jgi:hypothetical protein
MSDTGPTGDFAQTPGSSPQGGADELKGKIAEGVSAVKEEVSSFADTARERAGATMHEKTTEVAGGMTAFADAIRHAADELEQKDQSFIANLVKEAANGLETMSRSLSDSSPQDMLAKARDLGRSNPAALLAASVVAGLAIGRFARSSAHATASSPTDEQASTVGQDWNDTTQQSAGAEPIQPSPAYAPPQPTTEGGEAYGLQGESRPYETTWDETATSPRGSTEDIGEPRNQ